MLRRLHPEQPESFAFTPANLEWAKGQIGKYPEGRQASAVIPLLWRAQEQEGWVTRPAIENIATMLGMAPIRVLEVASFYFMFQLQPVGSVAHIQICGTTSCMICGAEDLVGVCKNKIAGNPHEISEDGKFSWEEVECLGACTNAPMAQIGKDYYEDLTVDSLSGLLDSMARGEVPTPGPQNGRYASEPLGGLTSLLDGEHGYAGNSSVSLATEAGETLKRITGDEPVLRMPVFGAAGSAIAAGQNAEPVAEVARAMGISPDEADDVGGAADDAGGANDAGSAPETLTAPRDGKADDLKKIKGVGPKLEEALNNLGFYHFDQIAGWSDADLAWVDENMVDFKGRASRDDWVGQSGLLAAGEETEFSKRVDKGDVYDD